MTVSQTSFGSHQPVLEVKDLTVNTAATPAPHRRRRRLLLHRRRRDLRPGRRIRLRQIHHRQRDHAAARDPAEITAGSIRFGGKDVLALDAGELRRFRWQDVAMVFQSAMNSLNPVMTIGDQIVDIFTTHAGYTGRSRCGGPPSCWSWSASTRPG